MAERFSFAESIVLWRHDASQTLVEIRLIARLGGYVAHVRDDEPAPQAVSLGMKWMYDIANRWQQFGPGNS